jgi:uncharacterized protein (DUF1697 family)
VVLGDNFELMAKYIAFLRAINVGGHTVKMDYLRQLFGEMGFSEVETFIASGNVIFEAEGEDEDTAGLERQIAEYLEKRLGYGVATFIRTPAEVAMAAECRPFAAEELEADGNVVYVGFLGERPGEAAIEKLRAFNNEVDEFRVNGREVYWLARRKMGESKFSGGQLEKALGMAATVRNVTTVRKLAAKYP